MADVLHIDASELQRNLDRLPQLLMSALQDTMEDACVIVEDEAAELSHPIDTGLLKGSITHYVEEQSASVRGVVGTNVEYAPYVHEGTGIYAENGRRAVPWVYCDARGNFHTTSGMKPRPFLRKALDNNRDRIKNLFATILEVIRL